MDVRPEKRESCGLFGVFGHPDAVRKTYYGLFALQHRGQESAGIVATDGCRLMDHLGMGLVAEVFDDATIRRLDGPRAIGHVRYSTTGSSMICNAQPMLVKCARGEIAVAHNGNLTNSAALHLELEEKGSIFRSTADSEAILHLYAQPSELDEVEHLLWTLRRLEGAFSLLFLTPTAMIGVRDPHGWRPLWLGRLGDAHVLASETCALDLVGAKALRELEPGEVVIVEERRMASVHIGPPTPSHCIFEHVYFARPDSAIFGDSVHEVRRRLGRQLARECPAPGADVVIPVPDSGILAAMGFADEAKLPLDQGFIRSHYVGRTFIQPTQTERVERVGMKLAVVRAAVEGKKVVVVDDSIVRGTTARSRVGSLRRAGAAEVHLRISCPPIRHPCFFGIDFPTGEELIANRKNHAEMQEELEVDSLGYLSLDGMLRAVGRPPGNYCTACFSGRYPIPVPATADKYVHEHR